MRLSRAPDLGTPRRMALTGAAVSLIAVLILGLRDGPDLAGRLGDTDDAMRMVMARALADGQGWWDQAVARLQPPDGVHMHWSRLIDGGIAALLSLFRLVLPDAQAETAARFVWPMLWILPAVLASLAVARRLAGGAAVLACAVLLLTELSLYLQFRPGRIDHHGIQIALCMLAFGGAALGGRRGAVLAGAATGLGMAIGLEALVFEVAIGGYFALSFLTGRDRQGRNLTAYAVALGVAAVGFFLIQTPPSRWAVAACDAVAVNLVGGVAAASLGLVVATRLTRVRDWRWRLGALVLAGLAAAGLYIGLNPDCLGGPFADVDPRLKQFWLPHVQEIRSIPRVWPRDPGMAFTLMAPCLFGLVAWLWLGRDRDRRADPFWIVSGLVLLLAVAGGFSAIRMATYANWVAVPIVAAAVSDLIDRYARGAMLALAAAACLATPLFTGSALEWAHERLKRPETTGAAASANRDPAVPKGDRCFHDAPYAELARLPAGLVLSEIDLGPFILAHTPSSALAAPYHRMSRGMLQARAALSAEDDAAEAEARRLGVRYVLECPTHARNADRIGMSSDSLQKRLDRDDPPAWLEPLPTDGVLRLYRVREAE